MSRHAPSLRPRFLWLVVPVALIFLPGAGLSASRIADMARICLHSVGITSAAPTNSTPAENVQWPPGMGERYPDLLLNDQNGHPVRLSDFAGRVMLIELAAVPCKGCQAFSGGHQFGGFGGFDVQPDLESIHEYAERIAGVRLDSNDVVFVQILLYGSSMKNPTPDEVSEWARHFQLRTTHNQLVLQGAASLLGPETMQMIPGFHLVDDDFVLRSSSCGHSPQDNLYSDLLPTLRELIMKSKRESVDNLNRRG